MKIRTKILYCDLLLTLESEGSEKGLASLTKENLPQPFLCINSKGPIFSS